MIVCFFGERGSIEFRTYGKVERGVRVIFGRLYCKILLDLEEEVLVFGI